LAIKYAQTHLPEQLNQVHSYFNASGAYARFKALLERKNHLDQWYAFEQEALKEAILAWCAENDISI